MLNREQEWAGARIPLIIVGPTAVGKTEVAIEMAARLEGEIINADSMQVYQGMDIGTAKPDAPARACARFHLLDVVRPDQTYNVADWKQSAEASIRAISGSGRQPIVCGGTGLYVRALVADWTLARTPVANELRSKLRTEADTSGPAALHHRLGLVDPATAARLHPNDTVRVVRALEVFETTGKPLSELLLEDKQHRRPRQVFMVGLAQGREDLYARINARVDTMIAKGFVAEVAGLLAQGYSDSLSPMRSLGYKELCASLRGEIDLLHAIEVIKLNTRRYCKRQLTWFRADQQIRWIDVTGLSSADVASQIQQMFEHETNGAGVFPLSDRPIAN